MDSLRAITLIELLRHSAHRSLRYSYEHPTPRSTDIENPSSSLF
jgi:hypothetical protein